MVEFPSIAGPSQKTRLGSEHRRRHLHVHSPAVVSRLQPPVGWTLLSASLR
ncbi:hypothetical protein CORC01_13810 [Colletotrichum orchidophilum]|uniref:Uncharacterized protein n=1 Tax=Colletotrichum orchidophilum TaxID=1209926 RepID=A0A1G4AP79_9PEZI|nr:uncharacterized protein CORC01_13810 [Colletotrichum orchidophilum]OHE90895.1 hypothetical protein CORC01_13810 [Colletotrichum orchidophilum]